MCIYIFFNALNHFQTNFINSQQAYSSYEYKASTSIESTINLKESLSLYGKTIVLDAGHDDTSNVFMDYIEGVTMLRLAQKIKPLLESAGATVYMTRENGNYLANEARAAIINIASLDTLKKLKIASGLSADDQIFKLIEMHTGIMQSIINDPIENGAIYFNSPYNENTPITQTMLNLFELQDDEQLRQNFIAISLHSNALLINRYDLVSGVEIYYMDNNMGSDFTYFQSYDSNIQEIAFSNIMLNEISDTGMHNNGLYTQNFMVVRETNAPCVLIENGYHTNDKDRELLSSDTYLDTLAQAYLSGLSNYFKSIS